MVYSQINFLLFRSGVTVKSCRNRRREGGSPFHRLELKSLNNIKGSSMETLSVLYAKKTFIFNTGLSLKNSNQVMTEGLSIFSALPLTSDLDNPV